MAKGKKKTAKKTPRAATPSQTKTQLDLLAQLNRPRGALFYFGAMFLFLLWLYKPIVFDGLEVTGSDVVSNIGAMHQVKEWEANTGLRALWNPFMFAGMPTYQHHQPVSWSIDSLVRVLHKILDWRIWYLMFGVAGMFLLTRYLRLHAITGMLAGLAFVLLPHMHALIVVGHFSKLRALMWMPMVLLTFLMLLEKRTVWSMLLFTAIFALQLRTQHYQIVFYTMLLLVFSGFWPWFKMLREKQSGQFLKFNGVLAVAVVLVGLIVAQPVWVIRDYTPYSTRGGNAVNINEQASEQDQKGVGFDYATNWSYTAAEWWNLIIPRFHGGTSNEGIPVAKLNNQQIPAYWGDLPFTQSYEYLGVIIAFLALVGVFFQWHNTLVRSLTALTVLALLLSLGKHFAPLYKLFFYYVPYFDKFRVPMMILTLVSFNVIVLAGFGLQAVLGGAISGEALQKRFYLLAGVFLALVASPLLFGSSLSLSNPQEFQQYAARFGEQQARQIIDIFREARLEVLKTSTWRTVFMLLLGGVLATLAWRKPASRGVLGLALAVLVAVDLGLITTGYLKGKFVNLERIEQQTYALTEVDRIIKRDDSLHRVLPPLRGVANDARWSYHHQSIGGYSPAKLQVIQDIISNNLINPNNPDMPLNLAVVSMLNGKYIVENQRYHHPDLTFLGQDARQNLFVFRNERVLPRVFFVDSVRVVADGVERLKFMNDPQFDPATTAVLEEPPAQEFYPPDSSATAAVTDFSPNRVVIRTETARPALLVVSEVFYPKGWRATLENGEERKIYKTNHILRSLVVPAGTHTITLNFHPGTYYTGIMISWLGWAITYLGLLFYGLRWWRARQQTPAPRAAE